MSEMVDRVARAIDKTWEKWHEMSDEDKGYADISPALFARAAIEAMREPTLAMIAAGAEQIQLDTERAKRVWQAMNDEGLR